MQPQVVFSAVRFSLGEPFLVLNVFLPILCRIVCNFMNTVVTCGAISLQETSLPFILESTRLAEKDGAFSEGAEYEGKVELYCTGFR